MNNKVEAFALLVLAMVLMYVGQQLFAQAKQNLLS
jgi:hypothetical protein